MSSIEDRNIEKRVKEIFECTQHPGFEHIKSMFEQKVMELESINSILSYPENERLMKMSLHSEVALRLKEILNQVHAESEQHLTQNVDEIKVYGAQDFGGIDD